MNAVDTPSASALAPLRGTIPDQVRLPASIALGVVLQGLRIRLGGLRRKQPHPRMGKKAALACLKLFFAHHAHGHLAPIRMKGHFSEHAATPFPLCSGV